MKLILNDGTACACAWAGASEGTFWAALTDMSLPDAAALFSGAERTEKIVAVYSESNGITQTFEGYTRLVNVHTSENTTMIGLQKETA